jgi:hypothetical protein
VLFYVFEPFHIRLFGPFPPIPPVPREKCRDFAVNACKGCYGTSNSSIADILRKNNSFRKIPRLWRSLGFLRLVVEFSSPRKRRVGYLYIGLTSSRILKGDASV